MRMTLQILKLQYLLHNFRHKKDSVWYECHS
jgi:hypothetical protein